MTIKIAGFVVDRSGYRHVREASVEALVQIGRNTASVGRTATAEKGSFALTIARDQWKRSEAADPAAFVFFRVAFGPRQEHTLDTRDSVRWTPAMPGPVRLYVDSAVTVQLRGTITFGKERPAAGVSVIARREQAGHVAIVGSSVTDAKGGYVVRYVRGEGDEGNRLEPVILRISIYAAPDLRTLLGESEPLRAAPLDARLDVVLPTRADALEEVSAALREPLSPKLLAYLETNQLRTLADLRAAGGVPVRPGMPVEPHAKEIALLNSIVALSITDAPVPALVELAQAGVVTVNDLALLPEDELAAALEKHGQAARAKRLLGEATHAAGLLAARSLEVRLGATSAADGAEPGDLFRLTCRCSCASATSPQAYLAHLLRFALQVLRYRGRRFDVGFLQVHLGQPFRDLPATCASAERDVAQPRLALEVLRKHLGALGRTAAAAQSPQWYREAAYTELLQFLDITHDELRTVYGSGSASKKARFVQAKGLGTGDPSDAQIVDDLYRDVAAPLTSPTAVTEPWLQTFFGLRSTLAAPLDPDETRPRAVELRQLALRAGWTKLDGAPARPLGAVPIVDPDLVDELDLQDRTPIAPTDHIYQWKPVDFLVRRRAELQVAEALIAAGFTPSPATSPGQQLRDLLVTLATTQSFLPPSTIPVPPFGFTSGAETLDFPALLLLRNRADRGENVSADLARFRISEEDVRALVHYVETLDGGRPVTMDESADVRRILLAHVKRAGFWPVWLSQERGPATQDGLLALEPEKFRLRVRDASSPDPAWQPRPRLAEREERQLWEEILRLRTRSLEAVGTDLSTRIEALEARLLPELRNELVAVTGAGAVYTREKVEGLTDRYQLDFEAGACRRTTRVGQAIETIQGLLFGVRNGLLNDAGWRIATLDFDATWRWLGAFDTWRAAVTAVLYPEHLLRPSLRRDSSPGFAGALQRLRDGSPVGQPEAIAAFRYFADYLNDVASLEVLAAATRPMATPPGTGDRAAVYLLGATRGRGATRIFWSVAIEQRDGAGDQSWWREVPAMRTADVVGAAVCGQFAIALTTTSLGTTRTLELWRLPLPAADVRVDELLGDAPAWEGPFALELPGNIGSFLSVTVGGGGAASAPVVVIQADETTIYSRGLALHATGWTGRFRATTAQPLWRRLGESDPYGMTPANGATFACRGNGASDVVAEERFVLAADVDGDGTDELIAFAGWEGFWSMKLRAVGSRQTWLPLGNRPWNQRLDCPIPARRRLSPPTLFFAVTGDFDGDGSQEVVAVHDADGPSSSGITSWLDFFVRKWSTASASWGPLGSIADVDTGAQILHPHPWLYPVGCVVGRFSQGQRDELLVTFRDLRTNAQVSDLVLLALVGSDWTVVASANVSAFAGATGATGGVACGGNLLGGDRDQLLLQQVATGGLPNGKFWTLQFSNGAWHSVGDLEAGAISGVPKVLVRDFDGDGIDEVALADDSPAVRFFKAEGGAWGPARVATVPSPVERWAAGDFTNDGAAVIVAQCAANPISGVLAHFDSSAAPAGLQLPDLTLGSGIPARWLVTGRFAGRNANAGIAALGNGCGFYVQSRVAPALAAVRPALLRFKPILDRPYRLDDPTRTDFTLMTPAEAGAASARAFQDNATNRPRNVAYLEEGFYFLAVEIALRLQAAGAYAPALDWIQLVARLGGTRLTAQSRFLALDAAGTLPRGVAAFDPLDAHEAARHRAGSYNRFTTTAVVRLLTDYGDAEFAVATPESLARARELYTSALAILRGHPYALSLDGCAEAIARVLSELGSIPGLSPLVPELRDALSSVDDALRLNQLVGEIGAIAGADRSDADKTVAIRAALKQAARAEVEAVTFGDRLQLEARTELVAHLAALREIQDDIVLARNVIRDRGGALAPWIPLPQFSFCVPPSAALLELKRRIELALQRLRSCLDIGGNALVIERLGSSAIATPPGAGAIAGSFHPLPYRYPTLIERAKQLLEIARQLEATMLNYVEAGERKRYDALNARRDLALSAAAERLKAVQVEQATQELGVSVLQRDRGREQVAHWSRLLRDGVTEWEVAGLAAQWSSFALKQSAAISTTIEYAASPKGWVENALTYGAAASTAIARAQADANSTFAQAAFTHAEYERRAQAWAENVREARRDVQIGEQQIIAATTRVQGVQVEQQIASLQTAFASEAITFLTTRSFASEALYEWMAGVLEGTYRFFLQQATQLARLAELQLAFERQEAPQGLVKRDYWTRMRSGQSPNVNSVMNSTDSLRGLTGAAQLLRDVYQLDQHAFLKNQRKQQLTETVSLARLDPLAFAQFARSGRIAFETPMALFDARFPGHYLRLLRRVRLTVIALVPPHAGIRATLSNAGVSRVVIPAEDGFDAVTLQRGFEQVAFTSAIGATGQFELDAQPELLNAFEGSGVDSRWVLEMPRPANPIAFESVADVLVTFEYTALASPTLREKVIARLPARVEGERVFSLRYEFPDAWYDLFNVTPGAPIEARFRVSRSDFPPNLERVRMTNLVLQVRFTDAVTRLEIDSLRFVPDTNVPLNGGGARLDESGVVSTRRSNGAAWLGIVAGSVTTGPAGEWTLRFSNGAIPAFAGNTIDDVLFSVSFEGSPPAWP